jgi:hypothetical protein
LDDQKNRKKRKKNYQLYELAKTKGIKVKVTEVERIAGTSKLIAIALRRMRAQTRDLRLTLEGVLVGLRSRVCSSESPPERENAKGWSLRVEDECSGEIYL